VKQSRGRSGSLLHRAVSLHGNNPGVIGAERTRRGLVEPTSRILEGLQGARGEGCTPAAVMPHFYADLTNRDRGAPHDAGPPTPPYVRVRIRRFGELCGLLGTREGRPSAAKKPFGNAMTRAGLLLIRHGPCGLPAVGAASRINESPHLPSQRDIAGPGEPGREPLRSYQPENVMADPPSRIEDVCAAMSARGPII